MFFQQVYSMLSSTVVRLPILLSFALSVACTVVPVQEMSDARQALEAAQAAQAQKFATAEYERAKTLLEEAESEWALGEYDAAEDFATEAKLEAQKARKRSLAQQPAE